MNLPKFNSADGRCYWMKPEVQEELQPLFDQCIQDAIDGKITRLDDSHWPPVVVSSQGAPFEVWQLLRAWTEIQRAETLDAEKAIAFSENLRRQSRWGEIDHHLLDMLKRELQEKYFVATGDEDDRFWDREYSLKPGIRAEQVPEPLLRFACYVAVSYKVYGMDFQYLDTNYLFGLVEKVRPDMVKKTPGPWNRQVAPKPAKAENRSLHRIGQRCLCCDPYYCQGQHRGMLPRSAGLPV